MKKHPRQAAQRRLPQPNTLAAPPMPPLVAMLARAVAPDHVAIPPEFIQAWANVARLVRDYAEDAATHPANVRNINETRYDAVRAMFMARVGDSRRGKDRGDRRLAEAVALLEQEDVDYLTDIEVAFTDPVFYTGLALGLYLLSNPAPSPAGGVR